MEPKNNLPPLTDDDRKELNAAYKEALAEGITEQVKKKEAILKASVNPDGSRDMELRTLVGNVNLNEVTPADLKEQKNINVVSTEFQIENNLPLHQQGTWVVLPVSADKENLAVHRSLVEFYETKISATEIKFENFERLFWRQVDSTRKMAPLQEISVMLEPVVRACRVELAIKKAKPAALGQIQREQAAKKRKRLAQKKGRKKNRK